MWWFFGCLVPLSIGTKESNPPFLESESTTQLPPADTSTETTTTPTETTPSWPQACDDIYDPDQLQTYDLDFDAATWSTVQSDCRNGQQIYRPLKFTWNGETVDAMARIKGNWSWSCDKMQFVISFNEADPDARFHGLRKLVVDAPWYDRTLLHERLAFSLFEARGLPYSCANSVKVNLNGSYYGVYTSTERIDHEYLERNFEDPSGNLYQGGSELKTNEDIGDIADLSALQNARTAEEVDALVDLDEAVAEWAMEAMIPAMDNYWAGVEINYYLYDAPGRGFLYLPYDMDLSFGDSKMTDGSLVWPQSATTDPILWEHSGWRKEALFKTVLADTHWCNRFVEELTAARAVYDPDQLRTKITAWNAQIEDAVDADPHKPYSTSNHDQSINELKQFLDQRADFVDQWLAAGGHCPARW